MEKDKLGYYYERKAVIERFFRGGQFVDAELHLIVSNSSPGSSSIIPSPSPKRRTLRRRMRGVSFGRGLNDF